MPQDASGEAERNDEDDALYVAGTPPNVAVTQASPSDPTKTTTTSTGEASKFQELSKVEITPQQEQELAKILADIEALEKMQSNPKFAESSYIT